MNPTETEKQEFAFASIGGRFLRIPEGAEIPEGVTVITKSGIELLSKEEIGNLYGSIAGVNPKNFKDKEIAVASLEYQVKKLPLFTGDKTNVVPINGTGSGKTDMATVDAGKSSAPRAGKSMSGTYELLSPPELEKAIAGLAPQAREIMLIMTELAQESGNTKIPAKLLEDRLKRADSVERLRTRQEPSRIFMYYRGKLSDAGLIKQGS